MSNSQYYYNWLDKKQSTLRFDPVTFWTGSRSFVPEPIIAAVYNTTVDEEDVFSLLVLLLQLVSKWPISEQLLQTLEELLSRWDTDSSLYG